MRHAEGVRPDAVALLDDWLIRGRVTPVSGARDNAHARAGVLRDRRLPRR